MVLVEVFTSVGLNSPPAGTNTPWSVWWSPLPAEVRSIALVLVFASVEVL